MSEASITSRNDLGSCTLKQFGRSAIMNPALSVLDSVTKRGNWKLSPLEVSWVREGRSFSEAFSAPTAHIERTERVELAFQSVAIELHGGEIGQI